MNKKVVALVYPKLPKAGLGNMLFVWANSVLFAEINGFPIVAPNWNTSAFRIGPYLRGERYKRFYGNLFSNEGYIPVYKYLLSSMKGKLIHYNPDISKQDIASFINNEVGCHVFVFDRIIRYGDCFMDLREHQPLIKQKLFSIIHPSICKTIATNPAPDIGIHVRLSDYRALKAGQAFSKAGPFIRTPMSWYVGVLSAIRAIAGHDVPATIFSDGYPHELSELLALPNVCCSPSASALSDMITLSRSKILITSSGSTFSYWASYLGQCPTVLHPACSHVSVLNSKVKQTTFEGNIDSEIKQLPELLIQNIKAAFPIPTI